MMGAAENAELGRGGFQDEDEMAAGTAPPPARKMQSLDFEHIGSLAAVAESLSPRSKWRMALRSIRIVIFQAKINVLLPFGPLAITLHYLPGNHVRDTTHTILNSFPASIGRLLHSLSKLAARAKLTF
jgi:Ca2+:H+ antiporter